MELQNFKALIKNDDAVSPVIGVVLMVAVTVILAAVIGSFVIGLGSETSTTPQASFEFDYGSSDVAITHDGGDTLTASDLAIKETGSTDGISKDITGSSKVTAGDQLASGSYESSETIRVVYDNPDNDKSATLASSTAP